MMRKKEESGLLYSTEHGQMCPTCGKSIDQCKCDKSSRSPQDGIVRVGRETKGRKGKGMTIITGIPLNRSELAEFAKQLKKRCGTGGTVKDGVIEIQGDHREVLIEELKKKGWNVKRSGGGTT